MILLCGIPSETPMAMLRDALAELNAPTLVFNQRSFGAAHFAYDVSAGQITGGMSIDGTYCNLAEITGIYMRMIDEQSLPEFRKLTPNSPERGRCRNLHDAMLSWMEIAPARVVNRCRAMASNGSKPYQAQLIGRHGFLIPETLITNDPDLVRSFYEQHRRVIYKSISGVRSIVHELTPDDIARLEQIRWCPTQFQAFVDGTNIRVHVVGQEVFATRIETDMTDYRYAKRQGGDSELTEFALNDDLSERCIRLADALGLPFAGIDLKIATSGEVFCFEVNPSPGYSYYQSHTGQPIAMALARYLCAA
jgi:hypothetical protein